MSLINECLMLLDKLDKLEQQERAIRAELQHLSSQVDDSQDLHYILKYDSQDDTASHIRQLIEESHGTVH